MYDPQFEDIRQQMQRFLDHMRHLPHPRVEIAPEGWQPRVDVYQTDSSVVVLVELAGLRAEDINLGVRGRILRIEGTRRPSFRGTPRQVTSLEIPYGPFARTVELPTTVDAERTEAQCGDGFLEIVLPLAQPVRPVIRRHAGAEVG